MRWTVPRPRIGSSEALFAKGIRLSVCGTTHRRHVLFATDRNNDVENIFNNKRKITGSESRCILYSLSQNEWELWDIAAVKVWNLVLKLRILVQFWLLKIPFHFLVWRDTTSAVRNMGSLLSLQRHYPNFLSFAHVPGVPKWEVRSPWTRSSPIITVEHVDPYSYPSTGSGHFPLVTPTWT